MCVLEGKKKASKLYPISEPGLRLGSGWCNLRKGEGLVVSREEAQGEETRPGLCERTQWELSLIPFRPASLPTKSRSGQLE